MSAVSDRLALTGMWDGVASFDIGQAPPVFAEIERLCREGLAIARVTGGPVDLAGDAAVMLDWLRAIRDFTACGVPVDWHAAEEMEVMAPLIHHLAPPVDASGDGFVGWRRVHRYGLLFWRRGPGFLTVVDRRREERAHHYLIEESGDQQVFQAAATVVARDMLAGIDAEALEELEAEGLVLSLGGFSLALPFRMRHWPVPFTAI